MYSGNSFLENPIPWFQPAMFATAGKKLELTTRIGPGWQVWMHVDTFLTQPLNPHRPGPAAARERGGEKAIP